MRIRSIRPEFWSSDDVTALSWDTRLIFIGLWSYVDDNGVGRDVDKLIVADLFPLEEDQRGVLKRVHGALTELSGRLMLDRYVVEGKPYLHVASFDTHQVINRKSKGRYPLPTCTNTDSTPETHDTLTEPSVSPQVKSPIGEGEKGRRGEGEKARGTRIPDPFNITPEMLAWAGAKTPNIDVDKITEKFIDYWRAVPGQRGVKLDWVSTWRNWMRDDNDKAGPRAAARPGSSLWDRAPVGSQP